MRKTTVFMLGLAVSTAIALPVLMTNGQSGIVPTRFEEYVDGDFEIGVNETLTPEPSPTSIPTVEPTRSHNPNVQPATTGGPLPGSPDAGGNTGGGYVSARPTSTLG